ncbi:Alpha/Beta hydrolase protein [Melampsora americana]|nr:Alpha/Beta hydrolase protein [Melampsora americana]
MPYLNIASDVEIYYEVHNSTQSSAPWLLILHPIFLDLTFASIYMNGQGELLERFNILLLDSRSHGRTRSKVSPSCDLWTLSVDLAFILLKLNIDQIHILASDSLSTEVSIRFAGLFPDVVLSLCMCAMPPATEKGFVQTAFFTVFSSWLDPEVPEDWEASVLATQWWLYGPKTRHDPQVLDTWAGAMMRRYPPCKAVQSFGSCVAYTEREAPPSGLYKLVRCPILVLHGNFENIYDVPTAKARFREFTAVGPGSEFKVLKGAPLQVFDANPNLIKSFYYKWIDSQLSLTFNQINLQESFKSPPDLKKALETLSKLYEDPQILRRDFQSAESFHGLSEEKIHSNFERLKFLSSIENTKFGFIGGNAPEIWTGASFEEMHPWRFSSRSKVENGVHSEVQEEIILAITEATMEEDEMEEDEIC